ncbi:MAG: hypothetical protein ACI85Q_000696 [Salibacteraceae bacterium]|jgi:hypothetical protein
MYEFFRLKLHRNIRAVAHWGVHPFMGIPLVVILFFVGAHFLFQRTTYASYLFVLLAIMTVIPLGGIARNSFLKQIFIHTEYRKVRVVENILHSIPFVIYLLYQLLLLEALVVFISVILISFAPSHQTYVPSFKTPFWRWPYESAIGFRKIFWLYPIAFFVVFKAIEVANLGLGIFGMEVVFIISMFNYFSPEPCFYVWMHQMNSQAFLWQKMGIAILYASFFALPIAVVLAFFFPGNEIIIFSFLSFGYGYLIIIVLAKYASYPKSISLPQGILICLSLYYPVIIIGVIPFLYFYTHKRLKYLLHDSD